MTKAMLVLTVATILVASLLYGFEEEKIIDIDGRNVFVRVSGAKKSNPYAFFLHYGPGGNSFYFEKIVGPEIEKYVNIIYVDLYGAGRSGHKDTMAVYTKKGLESFTVDRYMKDILYIADYVGAEKYGIIAHDFGAFVGMECVKAAPDRVLWFVGINPQLDYRSNIQYLAEEIHKQFQYIEKNGDPYESVLIVDKLQIMEKLQKDGLTEPERMERFYSLFKYAHNLYFSKEKEISKHPVAKKLIKHELFQTTIGQMALVGLIYSDRYYLKDNLPKLKFLYGKRVLIIESETPFVDPGQYERIRREFPWVGITEIPNGYFFPMIENKEATIKILKDFFKQLQK